MFNFNHDGVNSIGLKLHEVIMLFVTLFVVVAVVAVLVSIFFAKRKYFRSTLLICLWVVLCYAVAIVIANLIINWEDFAQTYQLLVFVGIVIVIVTLVIYALVRNNKQQTTKTAQDVRAIAYAAICLAVSFALSYVKLFRMPQGGSVTLGSVMLLGMYSYMFGLRRGLLACFVYGVLQSLQDPWVVHPVQFILDYPLAYTMFGFVALFKNRLNKPRLEIALGFAVAIVLRYICHFFSGSIFFGEYGADFGILNMWAWGAIYNLTVPIDGAIACILAVLAMSSKQVRTIMFQVQGGDEEQTTTVQSEQ